ncbi:MAG: hypothetical protein ACM3US_09915 [Sphingomonadaceae bacterium]
MDFLEQAEHLMDRFITPEEKAELLLAVLFVFGLVIAGLVEMIERRVGRSRGN